MTSRSPITFRVLQYSTTACKTPRSRSVAMASPCKNIYIKIWMWNHPNGIYQLKYALEQYQLACKVISKEWHVHVFVHVSRDGVFVKRSIGIILPTLQWFGEHCFLLPFPPCKNRQVNRSGPQSMFQSQLASWSLNMHVFKCKYWHN